MKAVFSSPDDELPLKSDKCAAICTDLHLGNRGITHLRGFGKFVSLDTVWLNDNELESIQGLERNNRLKSLHLYVNRIKKLEVNSFAPFKLLQRITLNDNFLEDLDGTLAELRTQRNLQSLDLFNNPIAKEDNYRMRVLAAIPSLTIFDLRRVTDAERVEVNIFRRKMNEMNQFNVTRNSKLKSDVIVRSDDRSNMEPNALSNIKELLSSHARGTRCFMEISFLEIDRRRQGTVEEEDFWRIMQLYGHSQLLNDREKELLMKRYRKVVKMKAVSAMGIICKTMVNYIDFCRDMLPVTQRIIHDSNAWRTERAPKVSVSTAALGLYVRTIREHQRVEESNLKKFSSRTQYNKRPVEMSVIEVQSSDSGLDAWEAGELSRIISSMGAPPVAEKERKKPPMKSAPPSSLSTNCNSNSSGGGDSGCTLMTREQCDSVFERFKELGKVPVLDSTHCLDMIFDHIAVGPTVSSILFRAAVGCPQCPRKVTVLPTVSNAVLAQKSRKLEPAADVRPVTVGPVVDPTGEIASNRQRNKVLMKWRGVTERESVAMDRAVTERAGGLLDSLLHAKDPSSIAALTAEAMKLGLIASRIGGQRIIKSIPKVQSTPGEVTTAASNRADIIVLPNLKTSLSASTKLSSSSSFSTSDYQKMGESRSSSGRATRSMSCEMPSFTSSFSSNLHSTGWATGTVTIVLG